LGGIVAGCAASACHIAGSGRARRMLLRIPDKLEETAFVEALQELTRLSYQVLAPFSGGQPQIAWLGVAPNGTTSRAQVDARIRNGRRLPSGLAARCAGARVHGRPPTFRRHRVRAAGLARTLPRQPRRPSFAIRCRGDRCPERRRGPAACGSPDLGRVCHLRPYSGNRRLGG
jgi:hypothetical protein